MELSIVMQKLRNHHASQTELVSGLAFSPISLLVIISQENAPKNLFVRLEHNFTHEGTIQEKD